MRIVYNNQEINAPDFMLVGAAKSGTTTIYHLLSQHPKVFFPKNEKEPFYFCFDGNQPKYLDPKIVSRVTWQTEEYINLYSKSSPDQICCDGSTAYLYHSNEVIKNIEFFYGERYKEIKIGMILRNPIERAYSHYTYLIRNGHETLAFEKAIKPSIINQRKEKRWGFDYLGYGKYYDQVNNFIQAFPHCKVNLFEDLASPQLLMNDLFHFLNIEQMPVALSSKINPSGIPKNKLVVQQLRKNKLMKKVINLFPERVKHKILEKRDMTMEKLLIKEDMSQESKSYLKEYYFQDITKLQDLINKDLQHWLK